METRMRYLFLPHTRGGGRLDGGRRASQRGVQNNRAWAPRRAGQQDGGTLSLYDPPSSLRESPGAKRAPRVWERAAIAPYLEDKGVTQPQRVGYGV